MVTAAQFRKLAMAFPEVEEKSHFEQPDFRVRNKIFAGLSQDHKQGTLKLTPELQAMVLSAEPEVFVAASGAWGRAGWTRIVLAQAELPGLRELLAESFRLVAPKRLLVDLVQRAKHPGLQDELPEASGAKRPRPRSSGAGSSTESAGRSKAAAKPNSRRTVKRKR
jgi:hypothetical protein